MHPFYQLPAASVLQGLAERPIDLSLSGILDDKRVLEFVVQNLGIKLLYGTERVTEEVIKALFDLAKQADVIEKMHAMQEGEKINYIEGYPSENRSVLHTATRDLFENKITTKPAKEAAKLAEAELDKLEKFFDKHGSSFTDVVQIGIGGSDLGPRALYIALEAYSLPNRHVHFISNVDPDDVYHVLKKLNLKKTLFICVSKSGTTLETLTNEQIVREELKKQGLNEKDHFVAVTGKNSPMDDPKRYLESFYIWDYIGGRYSATSMVGGVCLSFALGIDKFKELLHGANKMDKVALKADMKKNLPLFGALLSIWNRNFLHLPTLAVIPYSQALLRFPAHLQQCEMESNGKRIDKEGRFINFTTSPILWGEIGTNSQHSFFQCIHQGVDEIPIEFIGFKQSQYKKDRVVESTSSQEKLLSNLFAQSLALAKGKDSENPNQFFPGNRPNHILLANRLDPKTLGALLSYYEHKIAFEGFLWDINSFDQEGVQLGKKLANQFCDLFAGKRKKAEQKDSEFSLGAAFLLHLED